MSESQPRITLSRRSFVVGGLAAMSLSLSACGRGREQDRVVISDPGYPDGTIFITPDHLAGIAENPDTVILDCSELATYRRGHLPRARHVWWQDTIELHNPVYGMLANSETRARIVNETGVQPDSRVVCYDGNGGQWAARVAWMLRYMGHRATSILIGGKEGWRDAGHQLTRNVAAPADGGIADIFDESIVAHSEDILARMDGPGLVILDTRSESERAETWHGRLREGQIPGSVWIPRDRWLDEHNLPVDAGALQSMLAEAFALENTAEVIVYGLHGTLACLPYYMLLALDRFHVRLYDGSWSQWGANQNLPVEAVQGIARQPV